MTMSILQNKNLCTTLQDDFWVVQIVHGGGFISSQLL